MKSTRTYWNPLAGENFNEWETIEDSDGNLSQLTIAEDSESGDYTRLTRFKNDYSTKPFGPKAHDYPEEVFVVSGRLYGDVVILELSYPSQATTENKK